MSRTLTLPDELYERLESLARSRGLGSIEELLEQWQSDADELEQRRETVRRIDALREELFARYGEMPDSTPLIREDRDR
jgi:ribbon-helix-helix CopG family protein